MRKRAAVTMTGAERQAAYRQRQQKREHDLVTALTTIASSRTTLKKVKEMASEAVKVWEYQCGSKT